MRRTLDLSLTATPESGRIAGMRVAGSTVLVAKGQLFLP